MSIPDCGLIWLTDSTFNNPARRPSSKKKSCEEALDWLLSEKQNAARILSQSFVGQLAAPRLSITLQSPPTEEERSQAR